jgi:hypothetical protein
MNRRRYLSAYNRDARAHLALTRDCGIWRKERAYMSVKDNTRVRSGNTHAEDPPAADDLFKLPWESLPTSGSGSAASILTSGAGVCAGVALMGKK